MSIHYIKPNEIFLIDDQIVIPHGFSSSLTRSPARRYSLLLFSLQDCRFIDIFAEMANRYPMIHFFVVNLTRFPLLIDILSAKSTGYIPMIIFLKDGKELYQFDKKWHIDCLSEWFIANIPIEHRHISFV